MALLPSFVETSSSPEHFKPGYVHRPAPSPLPTPAPSSNPTPTLLRRSTRVSHPPLRYSSYHTSFSAALSSVSVPSSYSQAVRHACWQHAMQEELRALQDNHTWDIVPCPPAIKPIGCK